MSIQSEITRIAGARDDAFDAIEDKGVTVPQGSTIDDMADLIAQISNGGEVWAAVSVIYPAGSTCTATNGTDTLTAPDTSGTVLFGIPEPASTPETWTVSCTDGTDSDSTTVSISEYGQVEYAELAYAKIYGVSWDGTSTPVWSRTDLAANFSDPVPYYVGVQSYGSPFDNLSPWKDMVRVTDSAAGEMVKIPKFWYKLTQNGSGMNIQIADSAVEGFSVCPACMDRGDGKGERDYILVGKYHCISDYRSVAGAKPAVSKTRAAFRNGIHSLGTGIYMMDWATRFTIWLLYLVEFANWNSQAMIGYGCGDNSAMQINGYTSNAIYHTGTTKSSRTSYGCGTQYRNIEGLWDNCYDFLDGCYNSGNGFMIILNPNNFSDSTGGTSAGTPTSGFPKGFTVKNINGLFPLFIPSATAGTNATYSCDRWLFDTTNMCITSGGTYSQSLDVGLFYISRFGNGSDAKVGARLMKLP